MAIRILNSESFGSNNTRESILLNYHSPIMAIIEEVIDIYQHDINEESANGFEAILSGVSSDNTTTIST